MVESQFQTDQRMTIFLVIGKKQFFGWVPCSARKCKSTSANSEQFLGHFLVTRFDTRGLTATATSATATSATATSATATATFS